jgi:hypothetical protein
MGRKSMPLDVGDLVELKSQQKKLSKFYHLRDKLGIVLEIKEAAQAKNRGKLLASVYFFDRERGRTNLKILVERLKRVKS